MGNLIGRRRLLAGAGGTAVSLAVQPWNRGWARTRVPAAFDRTHRTVVAPRGTTLEATIVPVGSGSYRRLGEGPGEAITVRTDLARPRAGREDRRRALAAFVHLTDQHLIDVQSPGRVEFLDREDPLFQSGFRPQEALTTQVATAMVHRINGLEAAPVTGRPFDAAVCTGDNVDNQQVNELTWLLAVLDGGTVVPDSGELGHYQGVQDTIAPDRRYWHPDGGLADVYKAEQGYPDMPGLLARAIAPFASPGLSIPWFSVYGNHDCNVQGNAARSDALDEVFTGGRKITGWRPDDSPFGFVLQVINDSPRVLADLRADRLPFREVAADPTRRTATVDDWISAHLASAAGGHGYHAADLDAGRLYYEFELAPGVVGVSLDTTNHAGGTNGSGGSIGSRQLAWLEQRLAAHHDRFLSPDGSVVRAGGDDRLVVVFSHHTTGTMDAVDPDPAHPGERRILGPELAAVLVRYPNVVAWVNGHTHTNGVAFHRHPNGHASGFWEVSTASHVDFPQQARVVELVDNADGTLSVFATMIEHAGPARSAVDAADLLGLASLSRELGANDRQAGPVARQGSATDRNVELVLPVPFVDPAVTATPSSTRPTPAPVVTRAPAAHAASGAPTYVG